MSSDRPLLSPRRDPDLAATTTTPVRVLVRVASIGRNRGRLTCRTHGCDRDRSCGTGSVPTVVKSDRFTGVERPDPRRLPSEERIRDHGGEEKQYRRGDRHLAADGAVVGGTFRLPCGP